MKLLFLSLVFFFTGQSAFGQFFQGKQIARAELLADASDLTRPFTVGIRFVLEPDWYLYWKNPGDSGLPVEVQWHLPAGWSVSELRHPVPSKFAYDRLVAYGYKDEVIFLASITPGGEPLGELKADLDWLVCKESCIRGKASVNLDLNLVGSDRSRTLIGDARGHLPQPLASADLVLKTPRIRETESGWQAEIELTGGDASSITDFFPEINDDLLIDLASIAVNDNTIRFRFDHQSRERTVEVRGLAVTRKRGFEVTVPFHLSSM